MSRGRWMVAAMMMLAPARAGLAQIERGSWELTLAGAGSSDKDFKNDAIGVNAGLGYFFTDWLELSGRQTISYTRFQGSSASDLSTTFALDLHLPLGDGRIVPF